MPPRTPIRFIGRSSWPVIWPIIEPACEREGRMTSAGLKGLAVSTTSAEALAAYGRGIDLFLRWRYGALEALGAAAKSVARFSLAHCTIAYITARMGRADLAT